MKPEQKAIAIVASVVIVAACLFYALALTVPMRFDGEITDSIGQALLEPGDRLEIKTTLSGVTVTADAGVTEVTAHLYGNAAGFSLGGKPELTVVRSGDTVTVHAFRKGSSIGWNPSLRLDVVIPAGFAGDFICESSASTVQLNADLSVKSLRAHSSAGAVLVQDVRATGAVECSSSAGSVQTGAIQAASANIHTSAGRVAVHSCKAATIRLHSSAGTVTAGELSGKLDASSSAGSVNIALAEIVDSADIRSSAGSVSVSLPSGASAEIEASSSAGSVSAGDLPFTGKSMDKRDRVTGTLGSGGPKIKIHSSAGSVTIRVD